MALGDELAVLTACDDELYVLIGARALCVRTRTLLRKSVPQQVVPRSENIRERPPRLGTNSARCKFRQLLSMVWR